MPRTFVWLVSAVGWAVRECMRLRFVWPKNALNLFVRDVAIIRTIATTQWVQFNDDATQSAQDQDQVIYIYIDMNIELMKFK